MEYNFNEDFPEYTNGEQIAWPFKKMEVGNTVKLTDPVMVKKGQRYAHVYGSQTNRKYRTKKIDGVLYVQRIQ